METKVLADFLSSVTWDQIGSHTVDYAKMCVQDLVGVALSGSVTPAAQILKKHFTTVYPAGGASILDAERGKTSVYAAAAINAGSAHSMDFDDLHNASTSHLGAITIPVALALCQAGHRNGRDLLLSVILGYEAGARIGEAVMPAAYRYWHTTALVGGFSSATVAASLMGLNAEQLLHCYGSAGTQASGLWAFLSNGSMSKCLHVANANICGIRSAELAAEGFTGAVDILENDKGFAKAVASEYDLSRVTDGLGTYWELDHNSFKPYPCCRHTHSADYGILKMRKEHGFTADDVVSIQDDTYQTATNLINNPEPTNPYAAKFSLQYCIAAALTFGHLDTDSFSEANLNDPKLRSLMAKIQMRTDDEMEQIHTGDPNQWIHRLTVTLKDGTVLKDEFRYPFGDFNNPFDWAAADEKFLRVTKDVLPKAHATLLLERLHTLDTCEDVSTLFDF